MAAPRIVVVGSANVDLTTFTDAFPRAGETIFGREFHLGFGGKGANQAVAAALCGAEVSMVARVGDDLFGPATIENFRNRGVDTTHVKITPGVSSGVAPIFVESSGQNRILVVKGANDRLSPADIDDATDTIRAADCVVLQLEVPEETVYHTLAFTRRHRIRSILNPAPALPLDYGRAMNADYFIPNETEAEVIAGMPTGTLDEARECARQLRNFGMNGVILTLGENGALFAGEQIPARSVAPVDTTGAGDAFIGAFATFLASGDTEVEAIRKANVYAALSTLGVGTQSSFVTRARFEEVWNSAS